MRYEFRTSALDQVARFCKNSLQEIENLADTRIPTYKLGIDPRRVGLDSSCPAARRAPAVACCGVPLGAML